MTQDQPSRLDRLEATVSSHNEILNQIAATHRQLTEFSLNEAQRRNQLERRLDRHDETLTRIEANLDRLEEQTTRNVETMGRLELQMGQLREIVITSTTETMRLLANQARQAEADRQAWQSEIREIWQYLRYEPRNGNGRSE